MYVETQGLGNAFQSLVYPKLMSQTKCRLGPPTFWLERGSNVYILMQEYRDGALVKGIISTNGLMTLFALSIYELRFD